MRQHFIETGTKILVGSPAKPLPKRQFKQISGILAAIDEIREAHLPQVYGIGELDNAKQLLFIVVDPESAIPDVMEQLRAPLERFLQQHSLDVWPVGKTHRLIGTVRDANCCVGWRD